MPHTTPTAQAALRDMVKGEDPMYSATEIEAEEVQWLWPGRIPLGKIVTLDGDPATGKSTLAIDIASRVSRGAPWPDGSAAAMACNVLLMCAEDGHADTVVPRLNGATADLGKVHFLNKVPRHDPAGERYLEFPAIPRDTTFIEYAIRHYDAKLLIVDVLMAYLTGDAHRDQEVRQALAPLAEVAQRTGCAMLLLRHLNKGSGKALYRAGGSIGITGAARASYTVGKDPNDPGRIVMATTKTNVAQEPPSLAYRLEPIPGSHVARIAWEAAPVDITADELTTYREPARRTPAEKWLAAYLADHGGQAPTTQLQDAAKEAGFPERTIRRARDSIGARAQRSGFANGSVWVLG